MVSARSRAKYVPGTVGCSGGTTCHGATTRRFLAPPRAVTRQRREARPSDPCTPGRSWLGCGLGSNDALAVTRNAHIATLGIRKLGRIGFSAFACRSIVLGVVFRVVVWLHIHAMVPVLERKCLLVSPASSVKASLAPLLSWQTVARLAAGPAPTSPAYGKQMDLPACPSSPPSAPALSPWMCTHHWLR